MAIAALQHFHVFPDERGYLEGLSRREYDFALFMIAAGDDHEAVESWRITEYACVIVGAEGVTGTVLEQVEALLVDSQPQHSRPVRGERLLQQEFVNEL